MPRRPTTPSEQEKVYLVAARIKARRNEIGVGQETAALKGGLHPSYWTVLEQGRSNPTLTTLLRVAIALDTTVNDLLDGI